MSFTAAFAKKILARPELAQIQFKIAVLDKYLQQSGASVSRTNTVGRIKAASWSLDFGISSDEQSIHTSVAMLNQKLPEGEREHWLSHLEEAGFSQNFLKMQSAQSCIDDGGYRAWGEEEPLF
jgi:hypothetical protein